MTTFNIRIAALALATLAAGSAFAETPEAFAARPALSTADRAQVQVDARAAGLLTEAALQRADVAATQRTRAEVQAETRAAAQRGELQHAGEIADLDTQPVAQRIAVGPILAALTR